MKLFIENFVATKRVWRSWLTKVKMSLQSSNRH